ncbi:hypothetical protein VNI00_002091 [Paramarasmius palmivorus]|uniref:Beta-lactamase-related domain-containing protein n=1 Tax=Paramarasmius palmivorus TaxID=297713 RepID=A0AAW0E3U7_9AGAR
MGDIPLTLLVVLLLQASILAQKVQQPFQYSNSKAILTPKIDLFIETVLSSWNSPGGVSVAVVKQTEEHSWHVETKGYGIEKVAEEKKMDGNSLFCIASNSKLFATVAIGLLISDEDLSPRISWDTKLSDVLPEDIWKLADSIASSETTITDAMSHRIGLPRHDLMYTRTDTTDSILQRLRYLKPSASFRSTWQYNNDMYMLLAYLPTAILPGNPPFARYVKERIIDPLGLNSTTYSPLVANRSGHLADPVAREGIDAEKDIFGKGKTRVMRFPGWFLDQSEDGNFEAGPGGVIMSGKDAARWLQVLLLEGQHPETHEQIIPKEVIRKVASGITVMPTEPKYPEISDTIYGGGQMRRAYRGHNFIEHGGSTNGYRTQIIRSPDSRVGVAVFSNDENYGTQLIEVIKWRIIDSVLGLEPIDWDSRLKKEVQESHAKRLSEMKPRPTNPSSPVLPFEQLAGVYRNLGYGDISLCFANSDAKQSASCRKLLKELPTVLPGALNDTVPTLVAQWERFWSSHVKLEHFDGALFNLTTFESQPTDDDSDPCWTVKPTAVDGIITAEFAVDDDGNVGFGVTGGIWGAGPGVEGPGGDNAQQRAEVWFENV